MPCNKSKMNGFLTQTAGVFFSPNLFYRACSRHSISSTLEMSHLTTRNVPVCGDEQGFIRFEESFIFEMQQTLRSKPGMESKLAVIELCAALETIIYERAMKHLQMEGVPVWSRKDSLDFFITMCNEFQDQLITRDLDWSVTYDENHRHPINIFNIVAGLQSGKAAQRKSTAGRVSKKAAAQQQPGAAPPVPKAPKAVKAAAPRKLKVEGGRGKGRGAGTASTASSVAPSAAPVPIAAPVEDPLQLDPMADLQVGGGEDEFLFNIDELDDFDVGDGDDNMDVDE